MRKTRNIRISEQLWEALQAWGKPFEAPEDALWRLVRSSTPPAAMARPVWPIEAKNDDDVVSGGTFVEHAADVLAQQPLLDTAEITKRALRNGLQTNGKTPVATMGARLYVASQKPNSPFVRTKRGGKTLWSLRDTKIGV